MANKYLTNRDFFTIQQDQLNQLIQGKTYKLIQAQATAMAELTSYLIQRFDMNYEFRDTNIYDYNKIYNPGDRIILDYPIYSITNSYLTNDLIVYNGLVYQSNIDQSPAAFNPSNWLLIGNQYDMYSVIYNWQEFDDVQFYNLGDIVYWKGYYYTCNKTTTVLDQEGLIQYDTYNQIPLSNVFPDDIANNTFIYWNNKTLATKGTGILPSDNTYWLPGDTRSQELVMFMTDITIYHLHKSIAPMNIPELRKESYKNAIKWLHMCAKGELTPNLPVLKPQQGLMFRFGSKTKRNYTW